MRILSTKHNLINLNTFISDSQLSNIFYAVKAHFECRTGVLLVLLLSLE